MPAGISIQTASAARSSRRYFSIGFVALLHIAVVYILLTALDIIPGPIAPVPVVHFRVVQQNPATTHPMPPVRAPGVLTHPQQLAMPSQPTFDVLDEPTTPPKTDNGNSGMIGGIPGVTRPPLPIVETHTVPPYPPLSLRFAHEGSVRLRIIIDERGRVVSAEILKSTGFAELDAAAVTWVQREWRYLPAIQDGRASRASTNIVVAFRLDQARY